MVDYKYAELIQSIYEKTTTIRLHEEIEPIPIRRGVRQGDSMNPKLFIMQDLFLNLNKGEKEISIDGRSNKLKYEDEVVLVASSFGELQKMIVELNDESKKIDLRLK